MPLGLGLATSHAPSMFRPPEKWPEIYAFLTKGVPQPPEAAAETPEVLNSYYQRLQAGFDTLREQLDAYKPDALIIIGDDQNEVFSSALNPAFALFTGPAASGTTNIGFIGERLEDNHITLTCHPELAKYLLDQLFEHGFDPASMDKVEAVSRPAAGLGHAFIRPANVLKVHEKKIPTIPLFLNAYHRPMPTAARCFELGQVLREILSTRDERVAFLASGGLSHDPQGPRAGWVDEPLDRWVLDTMASGRPEALKNLFTFDSDTLRGGTGEIRAWIAVAGAFPGTKATIVEYVPARHSTVGLGQAYWRTN